MTCAFGCAVRCLVAPPLLLWNFSNRYRYLPIRLLMDLYERMLLRPNRKVTLAYCSIWSPATCSRRDYQAELQTDSADRKPPQSVCASMGRTRIKSVLVPPSPPSTIPLSQHQDEVV